MTAIMAGWYDEAVIKKLDGLAAANAQAYAAALPFAHAVFDDFLPPALVAPVLAAFPRAGDISWKRYNNQNENKLEFRQVEQLAPTLRELLHFLNSAPVLRFLERLTGIRGLISDPYFAGGGLHQIERGGKLGIHADFNRLEGLELNRRLNLLLYLNENWVDEYGGHLELWEQDRSRCAQRVLPIFNRCVVFSTTDTAFHGHPHPLACPEGWTRKSVATYYYTSGTDAAVREAHSTLWLENEAPPSLPRRVAGAITPPVVRDGIRWLRRKISPTAP